MIDVDISRNSLTINFFILDTNMMNYGLHLYESIVKAVLPENQKDR